MDTVRSVDSSRLSIIFRSALLEYGFGPFYGTPCGILRRLYAELEAWAHLSTIGREDTAVGVAAGSALGGARPVVLMQNSGFGNSVNALASLISPYRIPVLLIIGMRGVGIDTTAENQVMGRLTPSILDLTEIPSRTVSQPTVDDDIAWASATIQSREPAALLVSPTLLGWQP